MIFNQFSVSKTPPIFSITGETLYMSKFVLQNEVQFVAYIQEFLATITDGNQYNKNIFLSKTSNK